MKKNKIIFLTIYSIIGITLIITGILAHIDYYSSLMIAMGTGCLGSSLIHFYREYQDSRPENAKAVQARQKQQKIDLKDERKILLRHRAGYTTFQITEITCFAGSFIAALLRAESWIILLLFLFAVAQYMIAGIIYKHLSKKM